MPEMQNAPLVLVADDELSAANMLKHIFVREGYRVEIAQDGATAFQLAKRLQPDLIILDIMMPEMNGFEVLRHLRERSETAGIPTIIVSARAKEPSDIAKGLNIGADDYLSKPFAPQELLARARSKMRARQLEETLQQRTNELEALLRVSEELTRHLEADELLSLILYLVLDLLPGSLALICRLDGDENISSYRVQARQGEPAAELVDEIIANLQSGMHDYFHMNENTTWLDFQNVMLMPLEHGGQQLGILMLVSEDTPYTASHQMLFRGINRQAALALHNAELYEIQANYALHLEDMVAQRTEELKATQQMLLRSEKLASIGHLAASIAHEINNPLQPIRLNLEFILEDVHAGNPIDRELVEMTQNSVERIGRIVQQLLEFTKTGDNQAMIRVDLRKVLEGVIKLNARAFERDKIQIISEIETVPSVVGNKDQFEQVFMNLLINAKAAMENGDKLFIRMWQEVNKVRVQIEDTGSGIPEELIGKIFDPFVSTKPNGTGLGLFVTYGIVEKHQGEIDVRSEVGQGTVFTITLPIPED
jgi:signal transduction histidine kinase